MVISSLHCIAIFQVPWRALWSTSSPARPLMNGLVGGPSWNVIGAGGATPVPGHPLDLLMPYQEPIPEDPEMYVQYGTHANLSVNG